jgi:hypothetical protein
MTFDPTKPVQTRDGRKARIICSDRKTNSDFSIVVLITHEDDTERAATRRANGSLDPNIESNFDIINIPVERVGYVNYYGDRETCYVYSTQSRADIAGSKTTRSGQLKVTSVNGVVTKCEVLS